MALEKCRNDGTDIDYLGMLKSDLHIINQIAIQNSIKPATHGDSYRP